MSGYDRDPWASGGSEEPPVVRDKRRIDPETGAVRAEAGAVQDTVPDVPSEPVSDGTAELLAKVAELTSDVQRVQAEYVNYRRRVERDREAVREGAVINALVELLPILDDIGRARSHEELKGGFKVVAESLEAAVGKLGLIPYGEDGDPFDPRLHEALMHEFSGEVSEPTCVSVLQPGYRVGERVVRPARVKVAEPETYGGSADPPGVPEGT